MVKNITKAKPFIDALAQLLFPKICYACRKKLPDQSSRISICPECLSQLEPPSKQRPSVYSLLKFNPIAQELIHQLKYNNKKKVAPQLCFWAKSQIEKNIAPWNIDGIVPVPLFRIRYNERSYNQSEHIAKALSKILGVELLPKICKRVRYTKTQARLKNADARKKNLAGAFACRGKNHLGNKNLLVVDDVLTTGATLQNLVTTLSQITNGKIYGFTLATASEK